MSTSISHPLAHTGRRVTFIYRRDLHKPAPPRHPGIITGPGDLPGIITVRLDGTRSLLHVPVDYPGLHYLGQVQPVPDLPMGRFTPTLADLGGFEWEGVPVCEIAEDTLIAVTPHRAKAVAAMNAYLLLVLGIHDFPVGQNTAGLRYGVGVFEWEPEGAGTPWTVRLGRQGDTQSTPLHYLPL